MSEHSTILCSGTKCEHDLIDNGWEPIKIENTSPLSYHYLCRPQVSRQAVNQHQRQPVPDREPPGARLGHDDRQHARHGARDQARPAVQLPAGGPDVPADQSGQEVAADLLVHRGLPFVQDASQTRLQPRRHEVPGNRARFHAAEDICLSLNSVGNRDGRRVSVRCCV